MPQQIEFEGAVHEFPDDFSDADIAAALGGGAPAGEESASMASPYVAAGVGAAGLAPAIVAGLNTAAKVGGRIANGRIPGVRMKAPGVMAMGAAGQLMHGDISGAAKTGAGAAAMSQVPKALGALQRMTAPAVTVLPNGVKIALKSGGGMMARGAGLASEVAGKFAGPLGILSAAYDLSNLLKGVEDRR